MQKVSTSLTVCLVGAAFAMVILPASASTGFALFALNAIAVTFFVAPIVAASRAPATQPAQLRA